MFMPNGHLLSFIHFLFWKKWKKNLKWTKLLLLTTDGIWYTGRWWMEREKQEFHWNSFAIQCKVRNSKIIVSIFIHQYIPYGKHTHTHTHTQSFMFYTIHQRIRLWSFSVFRIECFTKRNFLMLFLEFSPFSLFFFSSSSRKESKTFVNRHNNNDKKPVADQPFHGPWATAHCAQW